MTDSQSTPEPQSDPQIDDPLLDHDYDGIQEYDNPLPGWWKWLFIASVLFSPPYFLYYHSGAEGRSVVDQYERELAENLRLQFAEIGELKADRETVIKFLYEPSWLQVGKSIFRSNCASCHGKDGQGLVGPNLTDDHYKNVKDIGDLLTVIQNGANAGAMPAWKSRLSTNELVLVAAYVASLRGTFAAGGKDPEGSKIPDWPPPPVETPEASGDGQPSGDSPDQPSGSSQADSSGDSTSSGDSASESSGSSQ